MHFYINYSFLHDVSVFCKQSLIDNSPFVLGFLEMRVREEEKDFCELPLFKKARQIFHCITSQAGNIVKTAWIEKPH